MSTIKSSDEHLTLNADGSSKDIKFQANGVEKGSLSSAGVMTATSFAGSGASLTGVLPLAGGTMTGNIVFATQGQGIMFGDGDTGFKESGDDSLQVHLAGSNVFLFSGSEGRMRAPSTGAVNVLNAAGSASAPVYSFNDDNNTGMYRAAADTIAFTTAGSERSRITSGGDVLIGTTNSGGRLEVTDVDNASAPVVGINANSYSSGTVYHIRFRINDSTKGSVTSNGTSVAYNTSSDYRLKENVDYTWDATTRLKQLKPARFNFIADDTNTLVDGFIAHEVSSIVPEAISGVKDATETYTDDEGNEQTRIAAQGIDQSKLVPLLVKTIQELEARITALES